MIYCDPKHYIMKGVILTPLSLLGLSLKRQMINVAYEIRLPATELILHYYLKQVFELRVCGIQPQVNIPIWRRNPFSRQRELDQNCKQYSFDMNKRT